MKIVANKMNIEADNYINRNSTVFHFECLNYGPICISIKVKYYVNFKHANYFN